MSGIAPLFIGVSGKTEPLTAETAGSKAAQLWRMSGLGLNVPPAFVMPTGLCAAINRDDPKALVTLTGGLEEGIAKLEKTTGRRFGDPRAPLLVSVRSGAAQSMPGMLSTILDVGLNADSVQGLIGLTGNPRLAWDSYRRFIQIYAEVVLEVPAAAFEAALARMLQSEDAADETELDPEALERLAQEFRFVAVRTAGRPVPDRPMDQLAAAAQAVYRSWDGPRARSTAASTGLKGSPARLSPSRRWSLAMPAAGPAPASPSRATRRPGKKGSMSTSSPTPRARMWFPAGECRAMPRFSRCGC